MDLPVFSGLRIDLRGTIAWLEYDRPPINAFDWEMLRGTRAALEHLIARPDVRVIVVASANRRHFSSGADLRVFESIPAGGMDEWIGICHGIVLALRASPKPLLACIEGTAVGGGLEITLHCDVRFAAEEAKLGQPEVNICFIPPIGATQALSRLIGRPRAMQLLYGGSLLTAAQALEWGLIDVMLPGPELRNSVNRYAESLARKPSAALAAIRRCVNFDGPFGEGLPLERDEANRLSKHPDFREGLRAFLEKRAPHWTNEP